MANVSKFLLALIALSGCAVSEDVTQGAPCSDMADCGDGETCYRGFCVPGPDAGGPCLEGETCYSGPEGTAGVGLCRAGQSACDAARSCVGEVLPGPETCGGDDEDCDGEIDEIGEESCDTGQPGVCAEGARACAGGEEACLPLVEPGEETCNGLDDDCDGEVDEGTELSCYPTDTAGCTQREDGTFECMGLCHAGVRRCVEGAFTGCMDATTPSTEPDDCTVTGDSAVDDDCDGAIDEDCECPTGASQPCYGGPAGTAGVGTCAAGTQMCGPGGFGECVDDVVPAVESCDGRDEDCDGAVDEGFDMLIDPMNCGACGDVCGEDQECCDGTCQATCSACTEDCEASGQTCCGTECADTATDASNCGGCGVECEAGQLCCGGSCVASDESNCGSCGDACESGDLCCDMACVASDASNCNACGTVCGAGLSCCASGCADFLTDEDNCGGCGTTCSAGQSCSNGMCCPAGRTNCGGTCVNQQTDEDHCGACGFECGTLESCTDGCCVATLGTRCPSD